MEWLSALCVQSVTNLNAAAKGCGIGGMIVLHAVCCSAEANLIRAGAGV